MAETSVSPHHPVVHADPTTARLSRIDGCPECVVNTETPTSVHDDGPRGFVANYVCRSCGHAWTTAYREDV